MDSRKLIIVSNREPYRIGSREDGTSELIRTTGGLVSALEPLVRQNAGTWIAWDPDGEGRTMSVPDEPPQFTLKQIAVSERERSGYYVGFANGALWPLFHYFIDRAVFEQSEFDIYERVNRRFADAVVEEAGDDALVWIQDYHFLLAPSMVREGRPELPQAFFLHIPFPSVGTFQVLPWHREILNGLLGADVVGFQTAVYVENFLKSCEQLLELEVDWKNGTVHTGSRRVRVRDFPIGIDFRSFEQLAQSEPIQATVRRLRSGLGSERVILSVDRLDYSKGILERLEAVEGYFAKFPERIRRDTFVQITAPSRTGVEEYQELKRHVDEAVGRINGKFAHLDWQPVRYIYRTIPREEVIAFYGAADVALVTPLRDGMNLVCKEYCAVQPDGVVVLSTLAGAARQFGADALMVNPFDTERVMKQIRAAVDMPPEERRPRMARLRERVRKEDVFWWLNAFLEAVDSGAHIPEAAGRRGADMKPDNGRDKDQDISLE